MSKTLPGIQLQFPACDDLARDMLLAGARKSQAAVDDLFSLSRELGVIGALRREREFFSWNRPMLHPQLESIHFPVPPGIQIAGPVVLGDGSVLAHLKPQGVLVQLVEGASTPREVLGLPFAVKGKALRDDVCYCLEEDGSRLCVLDGHSLEVVGVSEALSAAGIERPTSLCVFDHFVGVLSSEHKKAWILDADFKTVSIAKLGFADFLCNPTGWGQVLYLTDCPSTPDNPGGVLALDLDGRVGNIAYGLVRPLGLAASKKLLLGWHASGVNVYRIRGRCTDLLGMIPVSALYGSINQDDFPVVTSIVFQNNAFHLFMDLFVKGVAGPGRPMVLRLENDQLEKALEEVGQNQQVRGNDG